jgi:ankyrin repeat protein
VEGIDELYGAIVRGENARVRELVAATPSLARAANDEGLPALVLARYVENREAFDALLSAGPPLDVFEAAQTDNVDRLRDLLDADGALARAYSRDGFTALHLAAYYDAPNALRLLLDRGADLEAVTKNFLTNMALHAASAAALGYLEACRILLERGANVNAKQHGANTPLHTAGFRGDRELAELLVRHGADPSITNDEGQTAADVARSRGSSQVSALLRANAGSRVRG